MTQRGFTLVELLVSTALGLSILAGTLTAWMQAQRSYATAQVENRIHERAQYVFATLEPELQMAGFFGLGDGLPAIDPGDLTSSVRRCGDFLLVSLAQAVEFSDNRFGLRCAAEGRGAVPGTDTLTLRRASARLSAPEPGRLQLLGTLQPSISRTLLWNGELPAGTVLQPSHSELRDLIVRSYYVARSADGDRDTPALRVKSLTAISGSPAFVDTEVMAGIEDLQITTLPLNEPPQSVQVTLGVRADAVDTRVNEPLAHRRYIRHFALRNAP